MIKNRSLRSDTSHALSCCSCCRGVLSLCSRCGLPPRTHQAPHRPSRCCVKATRSPRPGSSLPATRPCAKRWRKAARVDCGLRSSSSASPRWRGCRAAQATRTSRTRWERGGVWAHLGCGGRGSITEELPSRLTPRRQPARLCVSMHLCCPTPEAHARLAGSLAWGLVRMCSIRLCRGANGEASVRSCPPTGPCCCWPAHPLAVLRCAAPTAPLHAHPTLCAGAVGAGLAPRPFP